MFSPSKTAPNRHITHPFDLKFGTDTSGYLGPEELVTGQLNDSLNCGYSAIAPSVFREAIRRWRETLPAAFGRVEAYSFVDAGCGKGRALFLAAELPFRKIIGIELNPRLARTAERNLACWKRTAGTKKNIRVMHGDATNFRWPRAPLLAFLYNPFDCSLVAEMAEKLSARPFGSGMVDLLYVNPTCTDTLTAHGFFRLLWTARIQMDEADQKADPYGTSTDLVSAYRSS